MPEGRFAEDELTLTIRPQPRSAMRGAAARIRRIGAITFSSHWTSQSSSVSWSSVAIALVPALFTSTSSEPKRRSASSTTRSPASGAVTSRASQSAPSSSAAARSGSSPRATSSRRASSSRSSRAVASPMPLLAPVTTQALPGQAEVHAAIMSGSFDTGDSP